ncbi:MAG: signal peptide peptidase SppA, partial [Bacteroidota bacterium]|nr:signal peptide peptidase SppA [Bacteroidota bacterium]
IGKSKDKSMGSTTISEAIRKAANDETVKAILFRINSPGGSALASEIILHEIELAKKKKPVVVSMGRYAASGGYYIACYADKIYAEPYTLTGSIGVFGVFFNLEKLLNNKLGVNVSVVKTNENSNIGGVFSPMSKTEKEFWTYQIEDIYDKFISHVAFGRNLTKEIVDSIGQGRIWVADDAVKIGLVDEIGGIDVALADAVDRAGIDEYEIVEYPKVKNFMEKLLEDFQISATQKRLGIMYDTYKNIQNLQDMQGIQARFVYDINIR